jgi:signal transduction histidine kinase
MTIRKKTIISISVAFFTMIAILLVSSRFVLLGNLKDMEKASVYRNVERALSALSYSLLELESVTADWSSWDDTYAFIENGNREYVKSNLGDSTFLNLRLNIVLFIDSSGKAVFSKAFDLHTGEMVPVPQDLQHHLSDGSLLLSPRDLDSCVSGLLLLRESPPLLIASRPILTSDDEGPAGGTIIFGRYLDATEVDLLCSLLSLSIGFYRTDNAELPVDIGEIYRTLLEDTSILPRLTDEQHIAGYTLLEDIYGGPGLIVKVEIARDIYQQGQLALTYLILIITMVCVVFCGVALRAAEKHELSRLGKLTRAVASISASGNVSERVTITGKDEISSLANNINSMLASLKQSEDELKDKAEHLQMAVIEAQSANQAKSEFLSSVSHELRTPLTAIIGLAQLLQKKYYGDLNEKQSEYVQDILESSNHLLSLINDILDLAKIEAGKSKLELVEVQIKELIDNSLLLVKENAIKKRIGIQLDIPEEVLNREIMVDKRRFRQIMINLLSNAIKFTGVNGKVIIRAESGEDELVVSVADTGIGIIPEEQERIFDAFYQVHSKTSGKSPGTGLGLSLAKRLVEQHHGRIWVESEGIGRGSRFSFAIPLRLTREEPDY